jgi:D-sedoheptulose 7-phosphate isomerase
VRSRLPQAAKRADFARSADIEDGRCGGECDPRVPGSVSRYDSLCNRRPRVYARDSRDRRAQCALGNGCKLLLAGNGGSAADAQHIAGELLPRLNYDRAPAAALALTTDTSVITAIGDDYGYERVFERQILGLGCPGDVFVAILTSGRSPNILRAIEAARQRRLSVVGFTGRTGGEMALRCDLCLHAPSESTPLIQQIHITAGHIVCGLIEERLFPRQIMMPG